MKLKKFSAGLLITLMSGGLSAGVAFADNVVDVIAAPNTNTIVEGSNTTVGYKIQAVSGGADTENGCNAADGTAATVNIITPAGVTATPSSLVFTACTTGGSGSNTQSVVFASSVAGDYIITATTTDNGGGVYDMSGSTFTLHVTAAPVVVIDTDAPVLSLPANMTVEATSAAGRTVTYTASASDVSPASPTVTCTPASGTTFPLGLTTVNCSATDAANNTANGSFNVTVVDTTAPSLPVHVSPADNIFTTTAAQQLIDWSDSTDVGNVSAVSYLYESSYSPDLNGFGGFATPIYGPAPVADSQIATGGTPEGVYYWHVKAVDAANNESAWTTAWKITVDNTAPTVTCTPTSADGVWHDADQTFICTSTDTLSGLATPVDATFTLSTNVSVDTENANASTGTHADVCDLSGNCTTVSAISGNMIDKKGPTVTITNPTSGMIYSLHQTATPAYSCTDAGSGMGTCAASTIDTNVLNNAGVFTVTGTDNVGNMTTSSVNYTVVGYNSLTIGSPLSMTAKDFKNASTIPVKFTIKNNDGSPAENAIAHLTVNTLPAKSSGSANSGDLFRYDPVAKQYIFNLSAKSLHPAANSMVITLDDGTVKTISFNIK